MMINKFEGKYEFLSNFYYPKNPIIFVGKPYPTIEHAFQAAKATTDEDREKVRLASHPGRGNKENPGAKAIGQMIKLRPGWIVVVPSVRTSQG